MDELKKLVTKEFKELIHDVMECVEESEKSADAKINLFTINKKQAEHFQKLDEHFIQAKQRMGQGKKGWF